MISKGSIRVDLISNPEMRGWISGPFFSKDLPVYNDYFAIKWAEHQLGDKRVGSTSEQPQKSIDIVLEGECLFSFPSHDIKYTLKTGEYIIYDTSECTHIFEALSNCKLIIIRSMSH